MEAFFALLQYIHSELSPPLHTPVMLIAQPVWTAKDQENITTFIFERFKTPGLCIMDSALATSYAFGVPNATVIDVGFEKVDVTAITDFQITGRGSVPSSGGEGMTQRLRELLKAKGFTRDMAEQLKLSHICEVLPPGTPLPGTDAPEEIISNPAAAASTGATSSGADVRITDPPRAVEQDYIEEDDINAEEKHVDEEGVLDVASILTSGKTQEFLAKKEREKAERAAVRKANKEAAAEAAAAAAKPVRLPNSKRPRAVFHYEQHVKDAPDSKRQKTPEPENEATAVEEAPQEEAKPVDETANGDAVAAVEGDATRKEQQRAARKEEKKKIRAEENPDRVRRDFEIGTERFLAADEGYLSAVADTVYRTVMSVDDVSKRQDAWDALIICGQGSKLRGFKEALIQTLNNRYLVSPSSATIFMSELPSNLATPTGTGSMTPVGSFSSPMHQGPTASQVNPLLLAATTASHQGMNLQLPGGQGHYQSSAVHSSHSQSPTSIKLASPPTYFPEWKTYEEAVFLGAQVAAKVIFVVDQGLSKGFLSRVEFNDEGPTAIHQM